MDKFNAPRGELVGEGGAWFHRNQRRWIWDMGY